MADSTPKVKILCTGDVDGKFSTLCKTVGKLNQKAGPFAALLCVGRFFDKDGHQDDLVPYLEGKASVPVPTYFITGDEDDTKGCTSLVDDIPDGGQLCKNLTFLGRRGVKRLPCGLTVARSRPPRITYVVRSTLFLRLFVFAQLENSIKRIKN